MYRQAQQLLCLIEEAVKRFPRYHKYTVGSDLRRQAMTVMRTMHRAVFEKTPAHVTDLMWAMEDLKLTLQLAKELGAFAKMTQFAPIAELAAQMGRQCGGWRRKVEADATAQHVVSP